jgi:hypothetical protein
MSVIEVYVPDKDFLEIRRIRNRNDLTYLKAILTFYGGNNE